MRWMTLLAVAGLLWTVTGCGNSTGVTGSGGKKMTLTTPGPTTIKQGETEKITVKVTREKFDDPIDIDFSNLPEGVTIEESTKRIPKGSNEATFTLKAEEKAGPKEGHKAKVSASSGDMKAGPLEFTINVKPKG